LVVSVDAAAYLAFQGAVSWSGSLFSYFTSQTLRLPSCCPAPVSWLCCLVVCRSDRHCDCGVVCVCPDSWCKSALGHVFCVSEEYGLCVLVHYRLSKEWMCVGVESGVRFSFDSGSESCDSSSLLGVIACHVYAYGCVNGGVTLHNGFGVGVWSWSSHLSHVLSRILDPSNTLTCLTTFTLLASCFSCLSWV